MRLPAELLLAARLLWREWRGGELGLLFAALLLSAALVTGIGIFAERLQRALVGEASVYLAADAVVQASAPVPEDWLTKAGAQSLATARTAVFPTMAYAGDAMQLVSLKAVTASYPLRGDLLVEDADGRQQTLQHGPASGYAWLDAQAIAQLDTAIGREISIGDSTLRVQYVIRREGDSRNSAFSMGSRVMIADSDLDATHLLQPGSRIEYRYLFAGTVAAIASYVDWLKPQLAPGQRMLTLDDNQPGIASALQKASLFLRLAGALAVLLAALAAASSAQRYCDRHVDMVAVLKTLGCSAGRIASLFALQLLLLWLLASLAGFVLALALQQTLLAVLAGWLPPVLPPAGWSPFALGAATALVALLAFVAPAFLQLLQVPPWRVLRRVDDDLGAPFGIRLIRAAVAMAGTAALLWLYTRNIALVLWLLLGLAVLLLLSSVAGLVLLRGARVLGMRAGNALQLALANIRRRPLHSMMQVMVFALGFMLLAVMVLLRTSLLAEWQLQLPADAPDRFLINIAREQVDPLQQQLQLLGVKHAPFYPMVKGRLVTIKGVNATTLFDESVNAVYRELNLSWSDQLPAGNRIVDGQWPLPAVTEAAGALGASANGSSGNDVSGSSAGSIPVSIEQGLAKQLHVKPGDRLGFAIEGRELEVTIASVRSLQWESMQPNFYFLFPAAALAGFSETYITSTRVPDNRQRDFAAVMREFPAITVYSVAELIERLRNIVSRASLAVEVILVMVVVAGVLVLLACLRASIDSRLHEGALLRTLGAGRRLLLGSLAIEFLLTGFAAGMLAVVGAETVAWALQTQLFHMAFSPHWLLWILLPLCSCGLIAGVGLLFCARVVSVPPTVILRET